MECRLLGDNVLDHSLGRDRPDSALLGRLFAPLELAVAANRSKSERSLGRFEV
jgi:hypothetical protein